MKKRLFALFLAVSLLASLPALPAAATEITEPTGVTREPGWCGEKITWAYADGTLTISGSGEMDDFPDGTPWNEYRAEIKRVVFSGGVTYIGANAFQNDDALESVDFGGSLYEIGKEAFDSCDGLTEIHLPASFKVFGEASFQNCKNLKEIHCEGRFPSFRQNCLWGTFCTIYYPAERPWGVEYIEQLETAFGGRIEFLASDGTDPYQPAGQETEPVVTEPETIPPATQPETLPVTEPVTEPVQTEQTAAEPRTEAPAQESTAPAAAQEEASGGGGVWTGVLIAAAVLILLVLGALIFRGRRSRGRFSA